MASRFTFPPQRDQGIGFTFPPTNKAESSSNNNQISIDIDPSGQDVLEEINEAPLNTFPLHQSVTDAPIIDIPSPTDMSEGTSLNNQLLLRQQQQQGTGKVKLFRLPLLRSKVIKTRFQCYYLNKSSKVCKNQHRRTLQQNQ